MINKQNIKNVVFIVATLFSIQLGAIEIKTEFYPHADVPKQYSEFCKGDCTIIDFIEWPCNRKISVTVTQLFSEPKNLEFTTLSKSNVMYIDSIGYTPGCPVTFTFQDCKKKKLKKEITIIPNRLFVKSPVDNAQIEATIAQANPALYTFEFTGFIENEELLVKFTSYDEQYEAKLQLSNTGLTMMPGIIDKPGGIARLHFIRSSGEILKLELPWGLEWIKYCMYYDQKGEMKTLVETEEYLKDNPKIADYFRSKR